MFVCMYGGVTALEYGEAVGVSRWLTCVVPAVVEDVADVDLSMTSRQDWLIDQE